MVDAFPIDAAGKVQKFLLRMDWDGCAGS